MKTTRQNFLLPIMTKKLLDECVPKGQQSKFVAETIEERLKRKKSWKILEAPVLIDAPNPLTAARKIRKSWERN
jgi:hypothetical protein